MMNRFIIIIMLKTMYVVEDDDDDDARYLCHYKHVAIIMYFSYSNVKQSKK